MKLLISLLVVTGCAAGRLEVVPAAQWNTVPPVERTTIDQQSNAQLIQAQAELQTATAAVGAAQHAMQAPAIVHRAPTTPADLGDDWAAALRDHERSKQTAIAQIDTAKAAWLKANLAWHQERLAAAKAQVEVVRCERELARAAAVDRHLTGDDQYDVATFRGQAGHAQERWYDATRRATQLRDALNHASAALASAKATYAQLVVDGPTMPGPLQLTRLTERRMARHSPTATSYLSLRK